MITMMTAMATPMMIRIYAMKDACKEGKGGQMSIAIMGKQGMTRRGYIPSYPST